MLPYSSSSYLLLLCRCFGFALDWQIKTHPLHKALSLLFCQQRPQNLPDASAGTVSSGGSRQLYACSGHFQWWNTRESEGVFSHGHIPADQHSAAHERRGTELRVSAAQTSPLTRSPSHGRCEGPFSFNV